MRLIRVGMFALLAALGATAVAAVQAGAPAATVIAIPPLTSPASGTKGNQSLAIAWQALWVAAILRLGAYLFRKTVLKSGPRTRWWKRRSVA